jgi:competence protein ComEA
VEDVPRPIAAPSLVERARDWLNWFGVARLVTSAIATLIVCAGGWWLVRTPAPPTEASLPAATSAGSVADTLPPPTAEVAVAESTSPVTVVVHVAGAVERPGVYELDAGSRVEAAIAAAGGASPQADLGALNLAAVVIDGTQIYVPEPGEVPPVAVSVGAEALSGEEAAVGPIDVNRATAAQLETLPGVGPATAAAIITERERNGPFVSVDDLERVPGIGPAKLAGFADQVVT